MINRLDIINSIWKQQSRYHIPLIVGNYERRMFSKVMTLYFKYMYDALLQGFSWHIYGFADIKISMKQRDHTKMKPVPQYYQTEHRIAPPSK